MKRRIFSNFSLFTGLAQALIPGSLAAVAFGAFLYTLVSHIGASSVSDFISMEKEVWTYILEYVRNYLLAFSIFGLGLGIFAKIRKEDGYESSLGILLNAVMAAYFLIH
ncbi:MAG: hypothetical protein IKE16_05720 [Solobacterium sp.]|nr:hypothetical protein [Solobacterium sp.]MBR2794129.1 hypothetical protein [Solobacterium sp.]